MAIEQEVEDTKELEKAQAEDRAQKKTTKNKSNKFENLLAFEAKAVNETNKQYGIVPSVLKKDQRSIEETLADIQQKKKLKTQHNPVE